MGRKGWKNEKIGKMERTGLVKSQWSHLGKKVVW